MTYTRPSISTEDKGDRPPHGRLLAGTAISIFGFLCPLFIPLVYSLDIPVVWQTSLAGFLAIGIPELFMVIAVAILGKPGFEFMKKRLASVFKCLAPPDRVSQRRYRIGLVLCVIPLLLAWLLPYFDHMISWYPTYKFWINLTGDVMLVVSLFVLGGDFWDKLRGLFIWQSNISNTPSMP